MPGDIASWAMQPHAWPPGKQGQGMPTIGRVFSDGRFEIRGIRTARCDVTLTVGLVDGQTFTGRRVDVAVPTTDLELVLTKTEARRGAIRLPGGGYR